MYDELQALLFAPKNSYNFLARNKVLKTNDAKYGYLQEIEKDGRRYIIASRHRFGSNTVEDVIVGVRV